MSIEVKNVTWVVDGVARFPDAVSGRATAHVEARTPVLKGGGRAMVLSPVARVDGQAVEPASDVHPGFAAALGRTVDAGVDVRGFDVVMDAAGVRLRRSLPVRAVAGGVG